MAKTIFKEIGIVLLLLIAIVLILGILLYDYIPNNKTVPAEVEAYTFPSDIKEELSTTIKGEQKIVRTYYIDSDNLSLYENTKEYNKGRANPFATTSSGTGTASATTTNPKSSGSGTNNGGSTNSASGGNTSQGEYYNNKAGKY